MKINKLLLVILIAVLIAMLSFFLYKNILNRQEEVKKSEPIGIIVFKLNNVLKKYSDNFAWEKTHSNMNVFLNDSILTEENSSAVIKLDNTLNLELGSNTQIHTDFIKNSWGINFERGTLTAETQKGNAAYIQIAPEEYIKIDGAKVTLYKIGDQIKLSTVKGSVGYLRKDNENIVSENSETILDENSQMNSKIFEIYIIEPKDGSYFFTDKDEETINFSWRSDKNISNYQLVLSAAVDFKNEIKISVADQKEYALNLKQGNWYFKIIDSDNSEKIFSAVTSFYIQKENPIKAYYPPDKKVFKTDEKDIKFKWQKKEEKEPVELTIAKDPAFYDVISKKETTAESHTESEMKPGDYYWRVIKKTLKEKTAKEPPADTNYFFLSEKESEDVSEEKKEYEENLIVPIEKELKEAAPQIEVHKKKEITEPKVKKEKQKIYRKQNSSKTIKQIPVMTKKITDEKPKVPNNKNGDIQKDEIKDKDDEELKIEEGIEDEVLKVEQVPEKEKVYEELPKETTKEKKSEKEKTSEIIKPDKEQENQENKIKDETKEEIVFKNDSIEPVKDDKVKRKEIISERLPVKKENTQSNEIKYKRPASSEDVGKNIVESKNQKETIEKKEAEKATKEKIEKEPELIKTDETTLVLKTNDKPSSSALKEEKEKSAILPKNLESPKRKREIEEKPEIYEKEIEDNIENKIDAREVSLEKKPDQEVKNETVTPQKTDSKTSQAVESKEEKVKIKQKNVKKRLEKKEPEIKKTVEEKDIEKKEDRSEADDSKEKTAFLSLPSADNLMPADGKIELIGKDKKIILSWQHVKEANSYKVRVFQKIKNQTIKLKEEITKDTKIEITNMQTAKDSKIIWEVLSILISENGSIIRRGLPKEARFTLTYRPMLNPPKVKDVSVYE
ncbi:MAG: FecR domain-containing protein [Spirochaetia bacterium]|nr:FecR domain-containing protein [Spirochaetia bacterium]